jgi:hypothetical protein
MIVEPNRHNYPIYFLYHDDKAGRDNSTQLVSTSSGQYSFNNISNHSAKSWLSPTVERTKRK